MQEERRECWTELIKDGTIPILFSLMISLNRNKDLETILKPIFRTIDKTKELKKYLWFYSVFGQTRIVGR